METMVLEYFEIILFYSINNEIHIFALFSHKRKFFTVTQNFEKHENQCFTNVQVL
jgi:hypothetical protein